MAKGNDKKQLPAVVNNIDAKQKRYNDLVAKCLEIIEQHNILFVTDLVAFLPFHRDTYYDLNLHKSDRIKQAIETRRILTKQLLKNQWLTANCATRQIALYKLICTDEERRCLSTNPEKQQSDTKEIGVNLANILRSVNEPD